MNLDEYVTDLQRRIDLLEFKAGVTPTEAMGNWKNPVMSNGWVNYNTAGGWMPASYAKDNCGIVHIRGNIFSGINGVVFTLPVGYRPQYQKYGLLASSGHAAAYWIGTNGTFNITGIGTAGATNAVVGINISFNTSEAVVYPVPLRSTQGLGWMNHDPYESPKIIEHRNGMYMMTGIVHGVPGNTAVNTTNSGSFDVDPNFTLDRVSLLATTGPNYVDTRLDIGWGQCIYRGLGDNSSAGFACFEGMIWPGPNTRTLWTPLTLGAGVTTYGAEYQTPAVYRDHSGWVHLKGLMNIPALSAAATIATIPQLDARPSSHVFMRAATPAPTTSQISCNINGDIVMQQSIGAGWISLDGLHFHTSV